MTIWSSNQTPLAPICHLWLPRLQPERPASFQTRKLAVVTLKTFKYIFIQCNVDDDDGGDAITRQKGRPPPPSVFLRRRWWQNLGWSRGGWEPLLLLQYIIFCKGHKTLAPQTSVFPRTLAPLDIFCANNSQQTKNVRPKVFRTYVTKCVFRVEISYQMWGANGSGLNLPRGANILNCAYKY